MAMISSAIQVFVRTRPTSHFAHDAIRVDQDTVHIHFDRLSGSTATLNNLQQDWSFKFAKVLHNENQESVFESCGRDMVLSTINGYNGTLMAYGQTGAGKTFTMGNATSDYKHRGITPRAISFLFRSLAARTGDKNVEMAIQVSYLEIYNETIRDLLADDGFDCDLSIREDGNGRVSVKGLNKVQVSTEEQALSLLFEGDANRAMGQHSHNRTSSRSHAIFTIYVESRSQVENGSQLIASKLNLVDLAGSERVAKTDSRGQTLQEALYINRSLSFLEQVVIALSDKNRDHIPFRSSRLTHVLRDSLGGNSITRLIANIWPEFQHLEETISTLKFATRMMCLTTNAVVTVEPDAQVLLKQYEREIALLKKRLAKHDMNIDRAPSLLADAAPESEADLRSKIEQYVSGEIEDIEVTNMRQMEDVMRQFKVLLVEARTQVSAKTNSETETAAPIQGATSTIQSVPEKQLPAEAAVVKDSQGETSDKVTELAGLDAKPDQERVNAQPAETVPPLANNSGFSLKSEDEMFSDWTSKEGSALNNEYSQLVSHSRELRAQFRAAGANVNSVKRDIDEYSKKLTVMRSNKKPIDYECGGPKIVIDEDEFALICELKKSKNRYMTAFKEWESLKTASSEAKDRVEKMKTQMAHEFLQWCDTKRAMDNVDILDDGEQFDKLETERILSTDPESLPYYSARKALLRNANKKKSARRMVAAAR